MSQSGYTPIQLYRTTTAAAAPTSGNLAAGELAINLTDEKLFFKNAAGTVKTLASSGASTVGGSNTQVQFNSSGTLAGSSGFVFDGTNVGIGATPAAWFGNSRVLQLGSGGTLEGRSNLPNLVQLSANSYIDAAGVTKYINTAAASSYLQYLGAHSWSTAASGSAGATATFTQAMTLDASGNLGVGTTGPLSRLDVREANRADSTNIPNVGVYTTTTQATGVGGTLALGGLFNGSDLAPFGGIRGGKQNSTSGNYDGYLAFQTIANGGTLTERMRIDSTGRLGIGTNNPTELLTLNGVGPNAGYPLITINDAGTNRGQIGYTFDLGYFHVSSASTLAFRTAGAEVGRFTTAGFLEAVYSDDVVALGNSGTATSIDLRQGNVFTATLTGNCTFTLTNPNANSNRGSSFTLILTNDGTAGRTVAWAGGTFRFPGGAAALSRTTTANAVDIWVFFTPNNGTTWYGNISMKNMIA
jgi:hypothetical protein